MTEKIKQRAEIKREMQNLLGDLRREYGLKTWPKVAISSEDMQADTLRAIIHCGQGETDSIDNAPRVRNMKAFVQFVRKYGAGVKMQTAEDTTGRRVRIILTFPPQV